MRVLKIVPLVARCLSYTTDSQPGSQKQSGLKDVSGHTPCLMDSTQLGRTQMVQAVIYVCEPAPM